MVRKKSWPKIDSSNEVQHFVNKMCAEYDVPFIKVIVKSKKWMEWFAGKGVSACAFWPCEGYEGDNIEKYIAFDGQTCRISGNERSIPIKISQRRQIVERFHTVIHEFIHHYFFHHYRMSTKYHGKEFRKIEAKINSEYGIYFFYSKNNYAMWFHNFWGVPYAWGKPRHDERGWI